MDLSKFRVEKLFYEDSEKFSYSEPSNRAYYLIERRVYSCLPISLKNYKIITMYKIKITRPDGG